MRDIYSQTEVYHTLDEIGKGTFGKVTKCWRGSDGELVAVKIMKIDSHRNRVIKNELKLIGALFRTNLTNSHIVKFFETFHDQQNHYLVFELLEKNLYQLQKENGFKPMAIRHIRAIVCQMLKALHKLKQLAIIHADLKPENIMVVDQNRSPFHVKLIDFGSASIYSEVRFVREPYIQSRFYRSPEILLGLPFCEKVDMWSMGCVMCELYLGWPLYPGESEHEQVRYICETQGLPRPHLLSSASKTHHFFKATRSSRGESQWQLKSSRRRPSSAAEGKGGERRKYILSSLDQLATLELNTEPDGQLHNEDMAAEVFDRRIMVDLLKRMLTLDSHQRVLPNSALNHPFISMTHLSSSPDFRRYFHASTLIMEQAHALLKRPAGDTHSSRPSQPSQPRSQPHPQQQHVQNDNCQKDSWGNGSMDYESQHAAGPTSEAGDIEEQFDEMCIIDEEGLEAICAEVAEEEERAKEEAGYYNLRPSQVTADSLDCTLQPSHNTPASSDCRLQLSDVLSEGTSQLSLLDPTSWGYIFQQSLLETANSCERPNPIQQPSHHPQTSMELQPQHHNHHLQPGEASLWFPQAECSFLGPTAAHGPVKNTLHSSFFTRLSDSQRLRYQPMARSSRSDPTHQGWSWARENPLMDGTGWAEGAEKVEGAEASRPTHASYRGGQNTARQAQLQPQTELHLQSMEEAPQPGCVDETLEEDQFVTYGTQGCPSCQGTWRTELPSWAFDPEIAPFLDLCPTPHAHSCCSNSHTQHGYYH